MVHYESVSVHEREHYGDEFDRVMHFDAEDAMRIIQCAARARVNYLQSAGTVPSEFYRGVLSLDPRANSMMMNLSYVMDYTIMLNSYAETGFLYADIEDGEDVDSCRRKAADLAADIGGGAVLFDILGNESEPEDAQIERVISTAEAVLTESAEARISQKVDAEKPWRKTCRFWFKFFAG